MSGANATRLFGGVRQGKCCWLDAAACRRLGTYVVLRNGLDPRRYTDAALVRVGIDAAREMFLGWVGA